MKTQLWQASTIMPLLPSLSILPLQRCMQIKALLYLEILWYSPPPKIYAAMYLKFPLLFSSLFDPPIQSPPHLSKTLLFPFLCKFIWNPPLQTLIWYLTSRILKIVGISVITDLTANTNTHHVCLPWSVLPHSGWVLKYDLVILWLCSPHFCP